MADRYTSLVALVLDRPVDSVRRVVEAAGRAGDIDRAAEVRGDGDEAMEVHWGGRMQKAVVRRVEADDGAPLLRTEAYIGDQGPTEGMRRQARLLQALSRPLEGHVTGLRDLSALADRDTAWMNRLTVGAVDQPDAIAHHVDGEGVRWLHTHGAARFDVPDLELYGLNAAQVEPAGPVLRHVHDQLLRGGLRTELHLPGGEPVHLVPVLDAWRHLNLDWPGVGRAGQDRGEGLDGPRATLSITHKPRLGRYRTDLEGVLEALAG